MLGVEKKLNVHILATANRLRMVQVDFADQDVRVQQDYLCEEIERALERVPSGERKLFLKGLENRFPVMGAGSDFQGYAGPNESSMIDPKMLEDPEYLICMISKVSSTIPDDCKEKLLSLLQEKGVGLEDSTKHSAESLQNIKLMLHANDNIEIDTDRFAVLISAILDFIFKLDPLVWRTWRKLSPRSVIKPSGNIKKTVKEYLCAKTDRKEIEKELNNLQRIVTAIITAVSRVGEQFARSYLAKFSPSEISALVKMEGGSVFLSHDVKCWNKYQELASDLTGTAVEAEVRKAVADYVESLMKVGRS